jgi:fused signal recognition particle receptor
MLKSLSKAFSNLVEKVSTTTLTGPEVESLLQDFYLQLVAADVAVETADAVVEGLRQRLKEFRVPRFSDKREMVKDVLKSTLSTVIKTASIQDVLKTAEERRKSGRPVVIMFVGPNGSGKTSTVVKLAHYLRKKGYSAILASADTFRAGAIEQLETLGEKAGFLVVSQQYGADPAAVAVDAINKAASIRANFVIIDTAGRTEVDRGLLEEMRKIKRVAKPDYVIYIGDALAGNVAVNQAKMFDEVVGVDFVVLAKLDADAKGGSAVSISHATGKPLLFVCTGQELDDLDDNPRQRLLDALGLA